MKIGKAGSLESNDVMITVYESEELTIIIHSIVDAFFHDQINQVIQDTLLKSNIKHIHVLCEDKGALDYTIKARLLTAIERMK